MKLKYYLRGLGIGIICTAIIMGIALSGNKKETMTDTEIIERARLLGMVMPEDTEDDPLENDEQDPSDEKDLEAETEEKKDNSQKDDNKTGKKETNQKPSSQQDKNSADNATKDSQQTDGNTADNNATQEMVQIEIKAGDVSATVCQALLNAGLISDAEAFNKYLTQKDVDQNLRVGVYEIPVGATQEQIVEILQK